MRIRPLRSLGAALVAGVAMISAIAGSAEAGALAGLVRDAAGAPVPGAMVSVSRGDPRETRTVWSGDDGRFRVPGLAPAADYVVRVRRIGWQELRLEGQALGAHGRNVELSLARETDPAALAAQLPANRWYQLALERIEDPAQREVFVRQCTYCHQQGSAATRRVRPEEEWDKLLLLMGRMGAFLPSELRDALPAILNAAYDPAYAVPALTARMAEPDFAPPPPAAVRAAVIDEWELGHRASMQHDLVVHPDGRIYSVDMSQDALYRLDVRSGAPVRESWRLPDGGLPLGGMFGSAADSKTPSNSNAHVGPHSIQVAPDGSLWMTLAIGNRLARFDPATETFTTVETEEGWYPHTLRFDRRGRIWYTLAASNHVGMYDPGSGRHERIRLPARTWGQALVIRMLPAFLWLSRHVDVRGAAAGGEGMSMPIPYGIDVGPDGVVWLSQLNEHRIIRVDPETFALEPIDTPFTGPRRLRFDSQGNLWIPGFSAGLVSRFDPRTRTFRSWDLPIEPRGSDVPYALNVDRRTDTVWICGTNSDSLIRFEPAIERFTVYPLPTRVTYTRELDFDADGNVWTSNSNVPTWQIEEGFPRVLRLSPGGEPVEGVRVAGHTTGWQEGM
jgi:streptogramin lyase